jgi:hypothetical protein
MDPCTNADDHQRLATTLYRVEKGQRILRGRPRCLVLTVQTGYVAMVVRRGRHIHIKSNDARVCVRDLPAQVRRLIYTTNERECSCSCTQRSRRASSSPHAQSRDAAFPHRWLQGD